ncbi:hypothetical protein A6R68_13674, partial [Neotoma lepida]
MTIILLSALDSRLHTPMYFFLANLSFLDMCFTTGSIPQMLYNLWGPDKTISYVGCAIQLYFVLALGGVECVLLAVMAYDRYAAVCKPLHYTVIMHPRLCGQLASVAWLSGFGNSLIMAPQTLMLPRCGHRRVDHFLCEMPALIGMACVDTMALEALAFALAIFIILAPLILILISYGYIARAVLRIKSAAGRKKAFNTCSSHLIVVSLFYGTIIYMYLQPANTYSQDQGKFLTLFYTIVTPSVNPLIYTLRNKDVKEAIKKKKAMEKSNDSSEYGFILVGFSDRPRLEMVLFIMLVNLWGPDKTISYAGCVVQLFSFLSVGGIECILLAVMAFDRYAAVCKPLHYMVIMHPQLCVRLVALAWGSGLINAVVMSPLTMTLSRCGRRRVNHFLCEMPALIKMACVDARAVEMLAFTFAILIVLLPLTLILVSYGYIAAAVLRI